MFAYRLLRGLLGFVLRIFYRQIEVVGLEHVPAEGEGPVLFAGNHPNSLLDPILIITSCGRIVHFAAKDVLFRSRLLRPILTGLGAVPIARRSDHPEGPLDNQQAFDRLFEVLARGRAMGIFPEGLSHDAAQLARLKTGAARIALGVAERHPGLPVHIVPCGLNYVRRKRFRTRVLVQFGPPIEVTAAHLAAYREDGPAAVRALTAELEQGLRALTVNAEDWDVLRVLDGVRRLYQPPGITLQQRIELARRFNAVYPTVKDHPEAAALYQRVAAYLDRLRALDLSDRDLRRSLSPAEISWRLSRHLLLLLVFLPLALPGAILHLPLGLFIGWAGMHLAPRKDVIATTKFVLGLLVMLLSFVAILLVIGWRAGPGAALIAAGLLPLSGYATLRVLERGAALRQIFRTLWRLLFLRQEIAALRAERAALETAVVAAVERFRPADMVPLFPRASQGGP
jgi:1-acyl-sn-glycerol-3-phosphate acyltransferase